MPTNNSPFSWQNGVDTSQSKVALNLQGLPPNPFSNQIGNNLAIANTPIASSNVNMPVNKPFMPELEPKQETQSISVSSDVNSKLFNAYINGQMTPQDALAFEQGVQEGSIKLPYTNNSQPQQTSNNFSLISEAQAQEVQKPIFNNKGGQELPLSVATAYSNGTMEAGDKEQLTQALKAGQVKLPQGFTIADNSDKNDRMQAQGEEKINSKVFKNDIQDYINAPEFNKIANSTDINSSNINTIKGFFGSILASDIDEKVKILENNFPDIKFTKTKDGSAFFQSPTDGKYYGINKGKVEIGDIAGGALKAVPYALLAPESIAGGIALGAGAEGANQAVKKATGGNFDTGDVAQSAVLGGVLSPQALGVVGKGIKAVGNKVGIGKSEKVAQSAVNEASNIANTAENTTKGDANPIIDLIQKASNGDKKALEKLQETARANPDVLEASKRLGLDNTLTPEFLSANPQFTEISQAIKNKGSQGYQIEKEAISEVRDRANKIIEDLGGSKDFSTLNESVKKTALATRDELKSQEKSIRDNIDKAIPATSKASFDNTKNFIQTRAEELGGFKNLSPAEQTVLSKINNTKNGIVNTTANYALINDLRTNLNASKYGKATEAFSTNGSDVVRDNLINALRRDQVAHINKINPELVSQFEQAQGLTIQRKALEASSKDLFGRNLEGSFTNKLTSSVTKLAKGQPEDFIKIIKSIPQEQKQEVVASSLAKSFTKKEVGGDLSFKNYIDFYEGLQKNKRSYAALMSNLPKEARQPLKDLYTVSKNIDRALNARSYTGLTAEITKQLNNASFVSRIVDAGKKIATGAIVGKIIPSGLGGGIAGAVTSILSKEKGNAIALADKLLSSPEFLQGIKTIGKGEAEKGIEQIAKSKAFDKFVKSNGKFKEFKKTAKTAKDILAKKIKYARQLILGSNAINNNNKDKQ